MWSQEQVAASLRSAIDRTEADAVEASLYIADRNISRFAESSLRQNMSEVAGQLTIRAWVGKRSGVATTSSLDGDGIARAARLARTIAEKNEPAAEFDGVHADPATPPARASFDEELAAMRPAEKAAVLGDIFRAAAGRGTRFAGTYTTLVGSVAVGNSSGLLRVAPFTTADALLIALNGANSGYASQIARRLAQLDIRALAVEAEEKACMLGERTEEVPPGEYDVILEPAALAEIFEWLSMIAFNGRSYEDGSSFLLDKLGSTVLGENVTLADDAQDEAFMPFPFDLEGRSKYRVPIVERGIARTPLVDSLFARRFGIAPTATCSDLASDDHGMPLHLSMEPGEATRDQLLASSRRAIWVTRFHYINGLLDPKTALMTGTTRDGTFLVEEGKPVARLANLRWTQSIVEAFRRIEGATRDRRAIGTWWNPLGGTIAPTVKVAAWRFTGVQGK